MGNSRPDGRRYRLSQGDLLRLDADEDYLTADALLEIADQVIKRKAMGRYIFLADFLFIDNEYRARLMSADGRIDNEDVGRPELPDEAGRALGSLAGIEDPKLSGSLFLYHLLPQEANAQAACGVIAFLPVPDAQHEQAFGLLEFPGNDLAPIVI